jgi:hypothetical protein
MSEVESSRRPRQGQLTSPRGPASGGTPRDDEVRRFERRREPRSASLGCGGYKASREPAPHPTGVQGRHSCHSLLSKIRGTSMVNAISGLLVWNHFGNLGSISSGTAVAERSSADNVCLKRTHFPRGPQQTLLVNARSVPSHTVGAERTDPHRGREAYQCRQRLSKTNPFSGAEGAKNTSRRHHK